MSKDCLTCLVVTILLKKSNKSNKKTECIAQTDGTFSYSRFNFCLYCLGYKDIEK
jgi:hypothetical protein